MISRNSSVNQFNKNKSAGFTFIEILTYLGIFAVIFGILAGFIVWVYKANIKFQTITAVRNNAQWAMQVMLTEIKRAKGLYAPTTTLNQLSLETYSYLPTDESSSYIDFFLCGTQLCLKKEAQNPVALTSNKVEVKNLNFAQVAGAKNIPSLQISFKVEYKNPFNQSEYQASVDIVSSAALRAY